jgi:hypothetical protein
MSNDYPEYDGRTVPNVVEICSRCCSALLVRLDETPWCYRCGSRLSGIVLIRLDAVLDKMDAILNKVDEIAKDEVKIDA